MLDYLANNQSVTTEQSLQKPVGKPQRTHLLVQAALVVVLMGFLSHNLLL